MLRSMYAGVSGLNSHQQMMDVTGNNISNVNTIGFKSSRVTFKEMLNQTIKGASAPQNNRAGSNPQQVGLGVGLGSIDNNMSSGNLQSTGKTSDVAIQGDGFFVLRDGNSKSYSRAGNFNFDRNGNLYSSSTGLLVQGWLADANGEFGDLNSDNIGDISLKNEINAQATDKIEYAKNLDAGLKNKLEISNQTLDLESGASSDSLSFSLTPIEGAYNSWEFNLSAENPATDIAGFGSELSGELRLNNQGEIVSFVDDSGSDLSGSTLNIDLEGSTVDTAALDLAAEGELLADAELMVDSSDPAKNLALNYDFRAKRDIAVDVYDSQGGKHTVKMPLEKTANNEWTVNETEISIDGITDTPVLGNTPHQISFDENGNISSGEIVDLSFTPAGPAALQTVELDFSELTQFSGQMTANFSDVNGYQDGALESFSFTETGEVVGSFDNGLTQVLAKMGLATFANPAGLKRSEGVFEVSSNSGEAKVGGVAEGGRGTLAPSTLEMSNSNLSQEFTNMITAQRGFQANSKLITTSDEMLQELVNLKR